MVQMKNSLMWSHTSALLAMTLNVNKDCKKHGVTEFDAFNPYKLLENTTRVKRKIGDKESAAGFAMMKKVFVDNAPEKKELKRIARAEAKRLALEKEKKDKEYLEGNK